MVRYPSAGDRPHAARHRRAAAARLGAPGPRRLGAGGRAGDPRGALRGGRGARRGGRASAWTSPRARCCPSTADGEPLCTLDRWRERRHAWPKLWKHHAAQPVADRLNEVALERGDEFLSRYGGRISSEWYFPKLIELWLEDREVYDAADALHRGDRLDRVVDDRHECARARPPAIRRCGRPPRGCRRSSTSRPPTRGSPIPPRSSGPRSCRSGPGPGLCARRWRERLGLPESVAVAVGNVDALVSVPGAGVRGARRFVIVDRNVDLRHGRPPRGDPAARDHRGRQGRDPARGCTATRRGRRRSATCSPGSSKRGLRAGELRGAGARGGEVRAGRDRAGRARLVQRQPDDPRRRRPHRRDLRADAAEHARGDLPGAARVDRVRQPADHGQLRGARARADRDRGVRRDRRAQPADDAVARRHERPRGARAGLARDPGPRRGAVRRRWPPGNLPTSRRRCRRRGRRASAHTSPTWTPSGPTTRCTRSTDSLYELLGQSEVGLLHGLKRIRTTERGSEWLR